MARRTLTIDNEVAAELAGSGDSVLRRLEDRLDCDLFLRGNVITLDGDDASLAEGQSMVEELVGLIERGESLEPTTVDAVGGAIDDGIEPAEMLGDAIWSHRGTRIAPRTPNQKRYVDASGARPSPSASARPAPARPSSPWRWPSRRSRLAR